MDRSGKWNILRSSAWGNAPSGCQSLLHSAGVRMVKLSETIQPPVDHRSLNDSLLDAWFELNYCLQEEAIDTHINKTFIEQWLMRLWTIGSPGPRCFWLFLARINELALVCASKYVDSCEFSAADEFLVQPCRDFFRVEDGSPVSGKYDIFLPLSSVSLYGGNLARRARKRIVAETESTPLLLRLYDLLKGSGYMTEDYLLSVSRRNEKIVQVAGMLAGLGMDNTEDVSVKLSCMDVDQRRDFRSRLCLFDRKTFNEIGRALHLFMHFGTVDEKYVGKYLRW